MAMRSVALVLVSWIAIDPSVASADKLGGFSKLDRSYLVNQDRVCQPVVVKDGAASGNPRCQKAAADVVAKLDMKSPTLQTGAKATFAATASGRTLTVTKEGSAAITWDAFDPIGKVVAVYANEYEDRVGVEYVTRRAGKDVTDVVVFDLIKGRSPVVVTPPVGPGSGSGSAPPPPTAPVEDPKLTKAVTAARGAQKAKALAAWQAVLAIDAAHSESMYRIAAIHATAKKPAEALAQLTALAKSAKPDALEWLIEARFDAAFAALRGDPTFRTATKLDVKAATPYERLMGFGGKWEQVGTACDKAEVRLDTLRDRSFALRVKLTCQGSKFDRTWKGTWTVDANGVTLVVPTKGRQVTDKDQMPCKFEPRGDEDQLHCFIERDLDFVVLPTRR